MREPRTWSDIAENCRVAFMEALQAALYVLILSGVVIATVAIIVGVAVLVDAALLKMFPKSKDDGK
jgi:hypothetical protein